MTIEAAKLHRDKVIQVLQQCIQYLQQTPDEELLSFMRQYNQEIIEFFEDEIRLLAMHAGEKVEPKLIKGKAVLIGKLGDWQP